MPEDFRRPYARHSKPTQQMTTKPKDPEANAAHQQAWRDRSKAAAGGPEVRGIFAPKPDHAEIKANALKTASRLARKRAKEKQS